MKEGKRGGKGWKDNNTRERKGELQACSDFSLQAILLQCNK